MLGPAEVAVTTAAVNNSAAAAVLTLENFLCSVEKRAYGMARAALGDPDDAMDAVQDSMLKLVKNYGSRDAEQWRKLFYRILYNRINDLHRYRAVQKRLRAVVSFNNSQNDAELDARDPETLPADQPSLDQQLDTERNIEVLVTSIANLPRRQREVFMLRNWEGMSTRDTAQTLKITEGSVKTHYSRALTALRLEISR